MSEDQNNVLEGVSIDDLKGTVDKSIFKFDDENGAPTEELKEGVAPTPEPLKNVEAPSPIAEEPSYMNPPTAGEIPKDVIGGGIVVDEAPKNEKQQEGIVVGPMNDAQRNEEIKETFKEYDQMIAVAQQVAAAKGQAPKADNSVVKILLDKTGMQSVEFTDEERAKMEVSKKIELVEVSEEKIRGIKIKKPKARAAKTIIAKSFDRRFAPFVAASSGYLGKMRSLSSMEVVTLMQINSNASNSADAITQKANLIYTKLKEASCGDFVSFDEFCKRTALTDVPVMLYALIRATYPEKEKILMNCANPKCVHPSKRLNPQTGKPIMEPNQFEHEYQNTDIILKSSLNDKLIAETQRIYDNSHTLDDAIHCMDDAICTKVHRAMLDHSGTKIVDIYSPTIYEAIEKTAKKVDVSQYKDNEAYQLALYVAPFIQSVLIKDTEDPEGESYNQFDELEDIIEIVYNLSDDELELLNLAIRTFVMDYQYKYGFEASTLVCPHCGQAFEEDVEIEIDQLLFLQAQRRLTSG